VKQTEIIKITSTRDIILFIVYSFLVLL